MEAKTQLLIPKKEETNNHTREDHFHVLAVDDSVIERKMLEKLLTISSYHVTCVESGDKALEYLGLVNCHSPDDEGHVDDHHNDDDHDDDDDDDIDEGNDDDVSMIRPSSLQLPDDAHHQHEGHGTRVNLIMTDYSMPGMSGYDLLKRVKGSSWKDVPVVVMSSENVPSRIHMCLEEGAEEFLLKPVRLADLKKLQPRIFKATKSTSCESGDNTCDFIEATDNNNNNNISKEDIIIIGDHEDYSSNSKEGDTKLNNEMEQFVKSSKSINL